MNLKLSRLFRMHQWIFLTFALAFSSSLLAATNAWDLSFKDLDGKTVSLSDYKGKWIVVNYWATWCPPCRVEMPELSLFHQEHKDKDAVVIGVNYETNDVAKTKQFMEEFMINFPVVRELKGANGETTSFGPLHGLPTSYMISPEGKVVAGRTGMVDQKMLEDFIKKYPEMKKQHEQKQ